MENETGHVSYSKETHLFLTS
jgi:hypothetical protein